MQPAGNLQAKRLFVFFSKVYGGWVLAPNMGVRLSSAPALLCLDCFRNLMDGLEARDAMVSPSFSHPGYGAFFRYGVVGQGFPHGGET